MVKATAEDWIILRLLIAGMQINPSKFGMSADVIRSLLFLEKKLGTKQFHKMLDEMEV